MSNQDTTAHMSSRDAMIAKYGQVEMVRIGLAAYQVIEKLESRSMMPTPDNFAVLLWFQNRSITNALTMYKISAESVLEEVLTEYHKMVDIFGHYDGPEDLSDIIEPLKLALAHPEFRSRVGALLQHTMAYIRDSKAREKIDG